MNWDVTDVSIIEHLVLSVRFADGTVGEVQFMPEHLTGVFAPLKNSDFFAEVYVNEGAVAWPNDIDLAPDAMYQAIKKHGRWVLK